MRRTRRCAPVQANLVVVGVDVAKESHVAVVATSDGRASKPLKFEVSAEGFETFLQKCREQAAAFGAIGFVVAMEPTGHYGATLLAWLRARQVDVYSVQPSFTNKTKSLYDGTRRKTDAKDALVIAELCRQGLCRPYRLLAGPFANLRVLSHQREQLVKRRTQTINRLHRHVDVVFPELPGYFNALDSRSCLWVLENMPAAKDVLARPVEELATGLYTASNHQLGRERADEVYAAAQRSIGISEGLDAHRTVIAQLVAELRSVLAQIRKIETSMARELDEVPYAQQLLSIPRLGQVTLATLLGEFGDLKNYKVARQLIAMAGLDLVENSSGKRTGRHHISRTGRAYARQMLYLAALRVGWCFLAEPRRRRVEENKGLPIKAAVANMARLLRVMHALVRDGKPFDSSRFVPAPMAAAA